MLPSGRYCIRCTCKRLKMCLDYLNQVQNINAHCILGYRQKMSEKIQLIRYENNERLGTDFLSNQNDHWNSYLSKNIPTCVFIGSFSINDVAIFGTQNILIICTSIFAKYGTLYSKYVHNTRRSTVDTGHSWAAGGIQRYIRQPGYIAGLIYGP